MENKYILNHGCHRGTLTSRDSASEKFDTYKEAHAAYLAHRSFYRSIGYVIWFAEIIAPDGKATHLETNPYR